MDKSSVWGTENLLFIYLFISGDDNDDSDNIDDDIISYYTKLIPNSINSTTTQYIKYCSQVL